MHDENAHHHGDENVPHSEKSEHIDHEKEKIERLRRAMYSRAIAPTIEEKPRHEMDQVSGVVGEDWVRPHEELKTTNTAPRSIAFARNAMRWLIYVSIAFFIGAAAFFAYYFFLGGGSAPASPGNIDISVSGPLQVQSGEPTELQIAVVNRNRVALELADLVIKYPRGTRSPTDLATDLPDQRIPLGTIEPGGRRQGTVSAVFGGVEGDRAQIKVELEYRLQDASAIFAAATNYQVIFASSPVSLSIESNDETISGQSLEFKVTIASNADAPVKDVLLNVTYPFGFTLESATPPAAKNGFWTLGDLNPGQKKTVVLRGSVSGESGDKRVFRFTAGTRAQTTGTSISAVLADYAHTLTVSNPFLGLDIAFNKDAGTSASVAAPGETVNVTVSYENHLATPIVDAVIVAQLAGLDIAGESIRSNNGFYRSSDRVMLWDKIKRAGIGEFGGGRKRHVHVFIPDAGNGGA